MNFQLLCQGDIRWATIPLGTSKTSTIGGQGCKITAVSVLCWLTPDIVNRICIEYGAFFSGDLLDDIKAAKALGMTFDGKTTIKPNFPCIAETRDLKSRTNRTGQHFFVWLGNGEIIDPLDGRKKKNPYNVISYRLYRAKVQISESKYMFTFEESIDIVHQLFGGRSANEQEKARFYAMPHTRETVMAAIKDCMMNHTDKGIPTDTKHMRNAVAFFTRGNDLSDEEIAKLENETAYIGKVFRGVAEAEDRKRMAADQNYKPKLLNK